MLTNTEKEILELLKKREDMPVNTYAPDISYEYFSDKAMRAYLQKYYTYNETINYFARYYKDEYLQFMKDNNLEESIGNDLLTAQEVVSFINDGKTTVEDVERWRKTNALPASGKNSKNEPLYSLNDLYAFLR